jgi:hypothetical protein
MTNDLPSNNKFEMHFATAVSAINMQLFNVFATTFKVAFTGLHIPHTGIVGSISHDVGLGKRALRNASYRPHTEESNAARASRSMIAVGGTSGQHPQREDEEIVAAASYTLFPTHRGLLEDFHSVIIVALFQRINNKKALKEFQKS